MYMSLDFNIYRFGAHVFMRRVIAGAHVFMRRVIAGAKQRRLLRESKTAETFARRSPAESTAVLNINTII